MAIKFNCSNPKMSAPNFDVRSILAGTDPVKTGSASTSGTCEVLLYDLGTRVFSTAQDFFNPILHTNMIAGDTPFRVGVAATDNFNELDFSGDNPVILGNGHRYAFVLFSTDKMSNLLLKRCSEAQLDPKGIGFTASSPNAPGMSAAPFGEGVRNLFLGVYAIPVPEPTFSMSKIAKGAEVTL